jgi:hypothetical protein
MHGHTYIKFSNIIIIIISSSSSSSNIDNISFFIYLQADSAAWWPVTKTSQVQRYNKTTKATNQNKDKGRTKMKKRK